MKTVKRLLYPIYAYCLFDELIFIYPLYAVMFQDRGLNPVQISTLFIIWSVTSFALEIPSGAVADKYSRKFVLLFAQIGKAAGFACWLLFPSFWGFAAGFIAWGASGAFSGGTLEALVFDELKQVEKERDYAKVMGRCRSMMTTGVMLASVLASPMVRFGYPFVLLAGIASIVVSCTALLLVKPTKRFEPMHEARYLTCLKEGLREVAANRVIMRLIVFVCLSLSFYWVLEEYWSLFGRQAGIPLAAIGVFSGALSAANVAGGAVAHRFEHLHNRAFFAMFLLSGLLLLAASFLMRLVSIALILAFCFLVTVIDVILDARLQHAIEVNARATVSSARNFAGEVASVPFYLGIGLISNRWGYQNAFLASAFVMILIGSFYTLAAGRDKPSIHTD